MSLSRREILKLGVFGTAALMLPAERVARTAVSTGGRIAESQLPAPFSVPFEVPPVLAPVRQTSGTDYYALTQRQASVEILPGKRTDIWGYNGITPGPTIVAHQDRQVVVQQINDLPDVHPTLRYNVWSSTHLHGSCSLPQYDGYASDTTDPGEWKDYLYPNKQHARSLWYHDHGVHITAPNAYMGLAAMYILHDPHELSLPIPHGRYDVPLMLRDAMFESNGQLLYDDNSQSGVYGDVNLVNGKPWPAMQVERRKYRFRILNAAISRSYDLSLDTGEPLTVIGTDAGLMPRPQEVSHLLMGMAERYEVVIDFSKYRIGQRVVLQNNSPENNIDYLNTDVVMAFDVVSEATDARNNEVPSELEPDNDVMALTESMAVKTRRMEFERTNSSWTINKTTWSDVINSDYELSLADPGVDDVEIWELENSSGGWFHPVHIHLVDFQVLDRNGRPPEPYERGPKDVVYVGEGEVVRVLMRFEYGEGRYMIHCHNLVHEDHDMMGQFTVGENRPDNDPMNADPAAPLPARPLRERRDDEDNRGPGGGDSSSGQGGGSGGNAEQPPSTGGPAHTPQELPTGSSGGTPQAARPGPCRRRTFSRRRKGSRAKPARGSSSAKPRMTSKPTRRCAPAQRAPSARRRRRRRRGS